MPANRGRHRRIKSVRGPPQQGKQRKGDPDEPGQIGQDRIFTKRDQIIQWGVDPDHRGQVQFLPAEHRQIKHQITRHEPDRMTGTPSKHGITPFLQSSTSVSYAPVPEIARLNLYKFHNKNKASLGRMSAELENSLLYHTNDLDKNLQKPRRKFSFRGVFHIEKREWCKNYSTRTARTTHRVLYPAPPAAGKNRLTQAVLSVIM